MLKTNKEIEEEFEKNVIDGNFWTEDDIYAYAIKSFIHQTRIADLDEIEEIVESLKKSSNTTGWCNDCNGHIANDHHQMTCGNYNKAISDIISHIQKVKEEIGKGNE